jgi:N-acetylglucosamine-6-phosphate deacetylase
VTAPDAGTPLLGLAAARVARPDATLDPGTVWLDPVTGVVVDVARGDAGPAGARPGDVPGRVVPLGDRTIAPGFVDVHVHGGAGRQVNGGDPTEVEASLLELAAFHARHGTTALVATTVSDSPERLAAAVAGVARAAHAGRADRAGGARVLGVHLEGPFLSPARAGAHDPACIRPPERAEMDRLLELGDGTVRLVTLAPELPGAGDLIDACLSAGATVALGHTDAGYEAARRAFDAGASHVTHLFDAMAPLHHRAPGLVTAALLDDAVTVELICDLHHLHPAAIELVLRVARSRTALVTDATAAAGLAAGPQRLGTRDVVVEGTRVALASDPSVLAGSALTMDLAVRLAVREAGVPLADALGAASLVPARVAAGQPVGGERPGGMPPTGATGTVEPGAPADLCILDPALEVAATLVAGAVVFDPGGLLS